MLSPIHFYKYQGLGNDFIIVDEMNAVPSQTGRAEPSISQPKRIEMCDRKRGIGADGIISVFSAKEPDAMAYMHITNADGSVPEMCGNGFRCVAMWLADQGHLKPDGTGAILTDAGLKKFSLHGEMCAVDMGIADFENATTKGAMRNEWLELPNEAGVPDAKVRATAVSMGNPHLVLRLPASVELATRVGPLLEHHSLFANRTNVEFVSLMHPDEIDVKVWERGVGITDACGTGACAAVAALVDSGELSPDQDIQVHLLGGDLYVTAHYEDPANTKHMRIKMVGPARKVFEGNFSP
jgi:diaminopimelate epimerase